MIEKVNPSHPDKVADRIAGALVDYAYEIDNNPKIAAEVLIGHGECTIIAETSVKIPEDYVRNAVYEIAGTGDIKIKYKEVPQDKHLSANQSKEIKCGDNGIFKGVYVDKEVDRLSALANALYVDYPYDGKFILDYNRDLLVVCQSNVSTDELKPKVQGLAKNIMINPIGDWTGGINVDAGATNRKLGSDMGHAVTGGGLHGKDLSKADVSVNIYAHLKAQELGKDVEICCAIGDTEVDGVPYAEIVEMAKDYITAYGGFEKFAEWGLV